MKNIYLPNQVAPSHSPCSIAWDKLPVVILSNEFGLMKFQAFGWPTMPHEGQPLADVVNEKSNCQYFDGYVGNDLPAITESSNDFLNGHTAFEGFYDTDELLHKKPYEHLVHAMYRDTDKVSPTSTPTAKTGTPP